MGIAEHLAVQQRFVLTDLRCGVQTAARVIELDVPLGIEPAVLGRAQRIEEPGRGVPGMRRQEPRVRGTLAHDPIVTSPYACCPRSDRTLIVRSQQYTGPDHERHTIDPVHRR